MNIAQSKLNPDYNYEATLLRIIDGDTVEMRVDLGFSVTITDKFRLWGINSPEMNTVEGKGAKLHIENLIGKAIDVHNGLNINTIKDRKDKYGRYLVVIYYGAATVNELMVNDGYASEYYP